HRVWQVKATHVDDDVEFGAAQVPQALRKMVAKIDALLGHSALRIGRDIGSRHETGACGNQHVATVNLRKAFRHLTAARIPDANEQHAFQRAAHCFSSFSRNSSWTRGSEVNSG